MLEKLKTIILKLKANNKSVWVFACLKMDESFDKWTLVISAPWVNESNRREEFQNIINLLKKHLNDEELNSVAGVSFLSKDSYIIEELLKRRSGSKIKNERINGNMVYEGEILESNPELNSQQS